MPTEDQMGVHGYISIDNVVGVGETLTDDAVVDLVTDSRTLDRDNNDTEESGDDKPTSKCEC